MGEKKEAAAHRGKPALYRRYRSTSFDELVGQEHVTELLKQAVKSGAISHAYLFTGQKGTGKTSAARVLAYAINNLPYSADSQHLDIIEIDAASNRRIDDIRDLREKVFIAPTSAKYKVYIIDEVHMLTGESFNALLKTLEEPPAHAVFILATTELHKVPATIVSRTQRFHFRPVEQSKVVAHLKSIAKKEAITIDEEALKLVADYGGGSFRDSIGLLDQVGGLHTAVNAALVESILGRASATIVQETLDALAAGSEETVRRLLGEALDSGVSPVTFAEQLVAALLQRRAAGMTWYALSEQLMNIPKAHFPQLLLTSVLLKFVAAQRSTEGLATGPTASTAAPAQPKPVEKAPTPAPAAQPMPEPPAEPSSPPEPQQSAASDDAPATLNWDDVLTAAKDRNAPLYSVVSRAEAQYSNGRLTLAFQYALHRKKMQQAQYKTQLSTLIADVCGASPDIIVAETTHLAVDETAQQVADIMGGGEVVQV